MTARRNRMAAVCLAYGMHPDDYRRLTLADERALASMARRRLESTDG